MIRRLSMRTRFVLMALICLVPLLFATYYVIQGSLNESRDKTIENEVAIAEVIAANVTQALDEHVTVLTDIASTDAVRTLNAEIAQATMGQFLRARPGLYGIMLIEAENQSVITSSGNLDPDEIMPLIQADIDAAFTAGEPTITGLIPNSSAEATNMVALIIPVRADPAQAEAGAPVGVLIGLLNVERLGRSFGSAFTIAQTNTIAAVVDGKQVIISQANTDQANETLINEMAAPIAAAVNGVRSNLTYSVGGSERVAVFAPVEYSGAEWAVVVSNPAPTISGDSRNFVVRALIVSGLAVAATLLLVTFFGQMISRSLRRLTVQAAAIAQGDHSTTVDIAGPGELTSLSEAVGEMADRLTSQLRDLDSARNEVAQQAERLRDLLRRTVRLQEDERRRIAGDIHDAVSPLITGALYQTRALELGVGSRAGEVDQADQTENLASISGLLERAMEELHAVIFALRPPDLDDLGVEAAIDRYVQQIERNGLPCQFEVVGEPRRLSPEARLAVYRIVQESLHNSLRHARADAAEVKMEWQEDQLCVSIRDNGSGFDPESVSNSTSLGLLSMRERAASIGATLTIVSQPGDGTLVMIERPYGPTMTLETVDTESTNGKGHANGNGHGKGSGHVAAASGVNLE
jgi:signal transduction histidine kinase